MSTQLKAILPLHAKLQRGGAHKGADKGVRERRGRRKLGKGRGRGTAPCGPQKDFQVTAWKLLQAFFERACGNHLEPLRSPYAVHAQLDTDADTLTPRSTP